MAPHVRRTAVMVWAMLALAAALVSSVRAAPSTKTVELRGSVVQDNTPYTADGSPRCAEKWILVIKLPPHVISYQASVNQPGLETFQFSGPPFTNPITGFGNAYTVPKGQAGWFLGGQSGPGACAASAPGKYDDIKATGVVPASSGGSKTGGGSGGSQCTVPGLLGKALAAAKQAITNAHCAVGQVGHRASARTAGTVLAQSPKPGTHLPVGSRVNLTLSSG